jgi:AAA+ superfamily predicted ATPase
MTEHSNVIAMRHVPHPGSGYREALSLHLDATRLRVVAAGGADVRHELELVESRLRRAPTLRTMPLRALGLGADELEFLWFTVAWTTDPLLAPHLTSLATEPRRGATIAAFARVHAWSADRVRSLASTILRRSHPALSLGLLMTDDTGPLSPLTAFQTAIRIVDFLAGDDAVDGLLATYGGLVTVPDEYIVGDEHATALAQLSQALGEDPAVAVMLEGATGLGRRTLVAIAAERLGQRVVALDLTRLPRGGDPHPLITALRREVALSDAVPLVAGIESLADDPARRHALVSFIDGMQRPIALVTTNPAVDLDLRRPVLRLALPWPAAPTRRALWTRALGPVAPPPEAIAPLALRYRLGPAGVARAATAARVVARSRSADLVDERALEEGVRVSVHERLSGVAQRIEPRQSWEDLIVPDETAIEISQLVLRARHSYQVLSEWGFQRHVAGNGIAALFSGPPGTGKTMAAGLIARELGLDLYRIDLSQVISKWIGETEKQLGRVFDAAETGHALLLFDEADSLFSKRTAVTGSNDRYANLEVNFLLQRIEVFGGIAILTTNLEQGIDDAFRRRLASHIQFPAPDDEERTALWRQLIPKTAPVSGKINAEHLASQFSDFAGGHIRNATLGAAYLAASEGTPIEQRHLERAARDVARSMGRVVHTWTHR